MHTCLELWKNGLISFITYHIHLQWRIMSGWKENTRNSRRKKPIWAKAPCAYMFVWYNPQDVKKRLKLSCNLPRPNHSKCYEYFNHLKHRLNWQKNSENRNSEQHIMTNLIQWCYWRKRWCLLLKATPQLKHPLSMPNQQVSDSRKTNCI
jgi:hypothetical protein